MVQKNLSKLHTGFILLILCSNVVNPLHAQENIGYTIPSELQTGFQSIHGSDGLSYIEFLACDELEGRDTADRGLRIARKYIQSFYKIWGIEPAGDGSRGVSPYEQRIRVDIYEEGPHANIEITMGSHMSRYFHGMEVFPSGLLRPGRLLHRPFLSVMVFTHRRSIMMILKESSLRIRSR